MIQTTHIQKMVEKALDTSRELDGANDPSERQLLGAINQLRHAACELEAEYLEHFYGVKQV